MDIILRPFMCAFLTCSLLGCREVASISADYSAIEFHGKDGKTFSAFTTGNSSKSGPVADVFLAIGDADPFFLPELTTNSARERFGSPAHPEAVDVDEYSIGRQSRIVFRGGKVTHCGVYVDNDEEFRIGSSKDGPFLSLPITKTELVREFGQPSIRISHGKWTFP
jgi:hypothetical protein